MEHFRAYKYRVKPNKIQANYLDQNFGAVRFLWNQLVANFNEYSTIGPNRPMNEKILKDDPRFPWLKEMISYALQQKGRDFNSCKIRFFNKKRKVKIGRPRFKTKGVSRDSFRVPGSMMGGNNCIDFYDQSINIPKLGWVDMVIDREFKGEIRSCTFSKNKVNQYFVSVLVKEDIEQKQNTGRSIGIDLGLSNFAIFSDGQKIDNPRWFRESQAKLKRAQQHLSRKQKGSHRREKQKLKVAKLYLKITNQRKDFQHKLSTSLVTDYDNIIVEDLNVKGMSKNHHLAKSIQDVSWSSFVSMLEYKSKWYGKTLHKIDRFFPSSKTCSSCGYKAERMDLSIREWECPECHAIHDRDVNAAKNILSKGLNDLYGLESSAELVDYRHGEVVRPEEQVPMASSVKCLEEHC